MSDEDIKTQLKKYQEHYIAAMQPDMFHHRTMPKPEFYGGILYCTCGWYVE